MSSPTGNHNFFRPQKKSLWISLGIVLLTIAVYGQVGHHAFIDFDDYEYITENPHVRTGLTFDNIAKSRRYIQDIAEIVNLIVHMSKPVIAMVNGVAAGAGFSLALACDLIFCGRAARFSQSFVRIGLIPDGSATYFLPRTVGLHRAKELMFTGDVIDAAKAYEIGLVNRLIDDDKLWEETSIFAAQLTRYAPVAIGLMKKILNQSDKLDLQAGIELETGIQLFCLGTEDHREGVDAFLTKRSPVFKGR